MEYKVNKIEHGAITGLSEGQCAIGLFKGGEFLGEGNFSGWYANEFYTDTTLIAYYILNEAGGNAGALTGVPVGDVVRVNTEYKKIQIRTIMLEKKFEAENDGEAFTKFWTQQF